jgi:hypothetical protein
MAINGPVNYLTTPTKTLNLAAQMVRDARESGIYSTGSFLHATFQEYVYSCLSASSHTKIFTVSSSSICD